MTASEKETVNLERAAYGVFQNLRQGSWGYLCLVNGLLQTTFNHGLHPMDNSTWIGSYHSFTRVIYFSHCHLLAQTQKFRTIAAEL